MHQAAKRRHTATCRPQRLPNMQRQQAGLLLTQPHMPLGPDSERVEQASGVATACFQQLKPAPLPANQQRQGWPAAVKRQAEGATLGGGSLSPPPKRSRKVPVTRHLWQGVSLWGCKGGCRMHAVTGQPCDPASDPAIPTELHAFAGTQPKELKALWLPHAGASFRSAALVPAWLS